MGSVSPPQSSSSSRRPGSSSSHSLRRSSFRETVKVVKRKLNNGTVIINKYRIVSELARGSYGSVYLCRDGDTEIVSGGDGGYVRYPENVNKNGKKDGDERRYAEKREGKK